MCPRETSQPRPAAGPRLQPAGLGEVAGPSLFQSGFWGAFKSRFGWEARAYTFRYGGWRGTLLTLARDLCPGLPSVYVPYGPDLPLPDQEQGPFLERLSEALADPGAGWATPGRAAFLRYDLPWETPYARERAAGGDPRPSARLRELRMNFGTREWNLRKAPTNVLPSDTVLVDLTAPHRALLLGMKPKTRYNVRLAARRGVTVEQSSPAALDRDLDAFHRLLAETSRRHGIVHRERPYFSELMRLGRSFGPRAPDIRLLLARLGGRLAAGAVVALHRGRAVYLYGASSRELRRCMATYALQWHAVQLARAEGCRTYDLFGIPPSGDAAHPMHGLYRFKTGFGGRILHRRGCWDYPLRLEYPGYRGTELGAPGFHTGERG